MKAARDKVSNSCRTPVEGLFRVKGLMLPTSGPDQSQHDVYLRPNAEGTM